MKNILHPAGWGVNIVGKNVEIQNEWVRHIQKKVLSSIQREFLFWCLLSHLSVFQCFRLLCITPSGYRKGENNSTLGYYEESFVYLPVTQFFN